MLLGGWRRRRRTGHAQEVLAAAGGVLDSSLDPRRTMRAIVRTAVPRLAELCVLDQLREDGTIGDSVAVAVNEDAATRLERLRSEAPLDPAGEHPVARVMRLREPLVIYDLTDLDTLRDTTQSDEHGEFLAWAGYRSGVVMPLIARGRLLGALSFVFAKDVHGHTAERLSLMRALADRAAMALDNANLYAGRTRMARTLQQSLLPDELPALAGVELSCAYHPSSDHAEVGGDFYDAFDTPSGSWLVVGDVCGKGPEAAAVTALVRHSVRALAFVRTSPAQVLATVNQVMLGHELGLRFATAAVACLRLSDGRPRVLLAGAGHPAPVLLDANAGSRCVELPGMMLGVREPCTSVDIELELGPAATLVMYTDGLLDAGAPRRAFTPEELRELVVEHGRASLRLLIQSLERFALSRGAGRLRDDVAILAARLSG